MKLKKSALAICIASSLAAGTSFVHAETDLKATFGKHEKATQQVTIFLQGEPALSSYAKGKANFKNDLRAINKAQDEFFKNVLAIDSNASITSRAGLLANFITVNIASDRVSELETLAGVSHIDVNNAQAFIPKSALKAQTNATISSEGEMEELMAAYTANENAGEGVHVGIVSTGIDYTLAFFGGTGEYGEDNDPETPPVAGSYLDALENGAIAFDGFPTETVVGGMDFASENWGMDENPIDQNYEYVHWNGAVYNTGEGTELASIVHQLAPGAKLHAYKIANVSPASWDPDTLTVQWPTQGNVISAIEHAMDPNQDGDVSDHLDVILIDSLGAGSFYDAHSQAGISLINMMIDRASAMGVTIVTPAGAGGEWATMGLAEAKHRGWIAHEAAPTATIAVGSVVNTDDDMGVRIADWSPMGPVRGSMALKPEIVTKADDIPVVKISNADSTAAMTGSRTDALSAAARIAAAAAVIKSNNQNLGPVEIKALLANTAAAENILNSAATMEANLLAKGHGVEDVDSAVSSPVYVVNKQDAQPYVQFGHHEVMDEKTIVKNLVIRNMSDSMQSYAMSFAFNGDKDTHQALTISHPQTVTVPAHHAVEIPVTVTIDGTMLPAWGLTETADYTDANLTQHEINGYFNLTSDNNPDIALAWMLQARPATSINKNPIASEYPIYKGWNPDLGATEWGTLPLGDERYGTDQWGGPSYRGNGATFVNESNTATTFEAYPVLISKPQVDDNIVDVKGHKIRAVGGAIYDEAMCEITGKKLVIAVNFHNQVQTAMANFTDKMGPPLFFYDMFSEAVVEEFGLDESFAGVWLSDEQTVNQPFVQLNAKGQPATYYIDYNKAFDWQDPNGRYTESKLPTRFAGNGHNVVSQLCVEELFHHELDELADFDQNFGFHIETDRDAGMERFAAITQFNPIKGGYYSEEEFCGTDWFGNEWCETVVTDMSNVVGFANVGEIVPTEEQTYAEALADATTQADFSHIYTAQPGEEVTIVALQHADWNLPDTEFMVISSSDDFMHLGTVGVVSGGSAVVQIAEEQSFNVNENAPMGTVVGTIDLDAAGFFGFGGSQNYPLEVSIVNTVAGTPFAIDQDTYEIYVQNPEALDYEMVKEVTLTINTQEGNSMGKPTDVMVYINNVNDIAPKIDSSKLAEMPVVQLEIEKDETQSFSIDFSDIFSDVESDMLTFTASGAGIANVQIDGFVVTGVVQAAGDYTLTVVASDGANEVSADFAVVATAVEEKDSGGSVGGMFALMLALAGLRRRL
ncbi:hypothetical protein E2K93_04800 [Thalassotalea sp. HSM 43]|uniref:S8 family serine peptidase n=1 Tax=Thalassotalea sp. HSM 43 TaxID=2552945 RepID=UPI001080AE8D|nr:S8 family serine peptidase [Thalassotalea sp. HSM 43]QBY03739.1 hypothetical protein E2K93_04800 [Thalassotalea sp. HSM 43]